MFGSFSIPARQVPQGNRIEAITVERNPAWCTVEACQPRLVDGATYSQMIGKLTDGEVLVARVIGYTEGRLHPQRKEIACRIASGGSYTSLILGAGKGNREIVGFYAIATDRLLSLLFAEHS